MTDNELFGNSEQLGDVISRQAAIDALDEQIAQCNKAIKSFVLSMKDEYAAKVEKASLTAFRERLEYLPPAQPQITHEQAVEYLQSTGWMQNHDLQMMLDGVHRFTAQPEPCEDAVSREEVLNCLEWQYPDKTPRTKIMELPPVTPKQRTGKWIDGIIPNDSGGLPVIVCDQCNTFFPLQFGDGHNFCPNCGAKMEGKQDG